VTKDPDEGVGADGLIVTGAAPDRVPAVYWPVLSDCTVLLGQRFGDRLHSLYLYGSVATGQAQPPQSDLDLVAVWWSDTPDEVATAAADLSARHAALVRDVGLGSTTLAEMFADGRDGLGARCFLRHYCVWLAGSDLRPSLPPCAPSRAVADGFNGDVRTLVQRWWTELDAAHTPADAAAVARTAARKLLLVAATLESAEHGGWTTDRATGAELLAAHHPERTDIARLAVDWSTAPGTPAPQDIHQLLDLGDWLAARP
jgi:hypothetical protein